MGVSGLGTSLRPTQATNTLASAMLAGNMNSLLPHCFDYLTETNSKSLTDVSGGLKQWLRSQPAHLATMLQIFYRLFSLCVMKLVTIF